MADETNGRSDEKNLQRHLSHLGEQIDILEEGQRLVMRTQVLMAESQRLLQNVVENHTKWHEKHEEWQQAQEAWGQRHETWREESEERGREMDERLNMLMKIVDEMIRNRPPQEPPQQLRLEPMCRSIKVLRGTDPPATPDDVRAAARQFVRKVSGFHKPSRANEAAFERAIQDVALAAERLLAQVENARRIPTPKPANGEAQRPAS